jgi:hypothetical protein
MVSWSRAGPLKKQKQPTSRNNYQNPEKTTLKYLESLPQKSPIAEKPPGLPRGGDKPWPRGQFPHQTPDFVTPKKKAIEVGWLLR